jgi:hypothetical protein
MPPSWPGTSPRARLDHSLILGKAWPEFASFVNATAQSGNWHASIPSEYIPFYDQRSAPNAISGAYSRPLHCDVKPHTLVWVRLARKTLSEA